jgi:HlyD family secretion protein
MTDTKAGPASDMSQVLGLDTKATRGRRIRLWLGVGVAGLAIVAMLVAWLVPNGETNLQYQTAEARRGDLTVLVTATGVIEPVNQVDVGTEVSGTVKSVAVDFNDRVKVGQVLARLDTDKLQAQYRKSKAAFELAEAQVTEAKATVTETGNKLRRSRELEKKGLCSPEDCDTAQAASERAQASQAVAEAQVQQAKAQLDADRTALDKAVIHSPINGIVLKRQVEPGQTVAASLQTPVLFTLAENLTQMELHVAVDEADVGQIKEGQHATFTVDAYPNRTYPATISQVRFAPQTVEGVVTYETVLTVDNSDQSLRPGMTATADITVKQLHDALLVPNTALRFRPMVMAAQTTTRGPGLLGSLFRRPHSRSADAKRKAAENGKANQARVWVLRDGEPAAIPVQTGDSDGQWTEVVEGKVTPGMPLLVDVTSVKG